MSTAIERAALRWRRVEVWSNIPAVPGSTCTAPHVRGETWKSVMAAREAGRVARERLSVRQTPEAGRVARERLSVRQTPEFCP